MCLDADTHERDIGIRGIVETCRHGRGSVVVDHQQGISHAYVLWDLDRPLSDRAREIGHDHVVSLGALDQIAIPELVWTASGCEYTQRSDGGQTSSQGEECLHTYTMSTTDDFVTSDRKRISSRC